MLKGETGLAGIGSVGQWTVELDEDATGQFAPTISHPRVHMQLPFVPEHELRSFRQSLEDRRTGVIGHVFGGTISVEFSEERVSFRVRDSSDFLELSLNNAEFSELMTALRQAWVDAELA